MVDTDVVVLVVVMIYSPYTATTKNTTRINYLKNLVDIDAVMVSLPAFLKP
jgi:hypothetical protein